MAMKYNSAGRRRVRAAMLERKSFAMKGGHATEHLSAASAKMQNVIHENQRLLDRTAFNRPQQHVGVYDFSLPALSGAPKGAYVINRGLGNNRFAVEMARWTPDGRVYLGFFDPNK